MTRTSIKLTISMLTCVILLVGCSSSAPATVTPQPTVANKINVEQPYDERANAEQDIAAGLTLAKADHKYVLLDFGGNWCPDCIVLAKFYETEPLKSLVASNYHLVSIDIGQFDKNLAISARYGNPIQNGVPAVVVLDPDGKMIGSTGDGALESARDMTVQQVYDILKNWTPSQN